jgi:hypothetical protein
MKKTIAVCFFVMGMLVFASTAFMAGPPVNTDILLVDKTGSTASEGRVLLATFACGGGYCEDGESCCDGYNACCPSGMNIYCSGSNTCYSSIADARADCGDSYDICWSPAD